MGVGLCQVFIPPPPRGRFSYSAGDYLNALVQVFLLLPLACHMQVPDYWDHFHKSTFCLAPAGWGWGARVKSAITRGCIPVIVQVPEGMWGQSWSNVPACKHR